MKPTKVFMLCLTVFLFLYRNNSVFAQKVVASIPVGTSPGGVAVNRITNRVYVANLVGQHLPPPLIEAPNTVTVIDAATDRVVDEIVTGLDFQIGLAVDEVRNLIYVTTLDNGVDVIDGKTDAVIGNIPVAGEPVYVSINTFTKAVYITDQLAGSVTVLDEQENNIATTIQLGGGPNVNEPEGVAVDPFTNRTYVADFEPAGSVWMIDGRSNTLATTIPVGGSPFGITVNPLTGHVYVANSLSQNVSVIDERTNKVVFNVPVAGNPFYIAVDELRDRVYSCSVEIGAANLSIINGRSNRVLATVPFSGAFCGGLAVDTFRNHIYFTNENSGSLIVIKGPRLGARNLFD